MISLGFDYAISITTDSPVLDDVLTEAYHAVNAVLATHLLLTNYDTRVDNLGELRRKLQDRLLEPSEPEQIPATLPDLPGPFGTSCPCGSTTHTLSSHPTRNFPHDIPDLIAQHRDGEHEQERQPECCAACVVALARATGIRPETYARYVEQARRQAPTVQTPTEGPST